MEIHHNHHDSTLHHSPTVEKSDIDVSVSFDNGLFNIHLDDSEGNAPILMESHGKFMHLIIISDDFQEFYHVHPTKVDESNFNAEISLNENKGYKAFVDISVKDKNYLIKPLTVSSIDTHQLVTLELDKNRTKKINGKSIELKHSDFITGKKVDLEFLFQEGIVPDPYLGALGHVVIIDKNIQQFIHVHPKSEHETIFETQFDKAGIYKLWGEFQFGDSIITFPFVFEVKGNTNYH